MKSNQFTSDLQTSRVGFNFDCFAEIDKVGFIGRDWNNIADHESLNEILLNTNQFNTDRIMARQLISFCM